MIYLVVLLVVVVIDIVVVVVVVVIDNVVDEYKFHVVKIIAFVVVDDHHL